MNQNYSGRIDPTKEEWEASEWSELLKERYHLASLFTTDKVVLDACCGTGFGTVNYITPNAKYAVGFDICDSALKNFGKTERFEFFVMDGRRIEFDAGSFDVILSLDAIEHFDQADGLQYLCQLARVCKEEGLLIGTTPLVIDPSLIPTYLEWNKFHLFMYTRDVLDSTLRSVFQHVQIHEIYNPVCPYYLFLSSKTPFRSCSRNSQHLEKYLMDNKAIFNRSKQSNYLTWASMLIRKKKLIKAFSLIIKSYLIEVTGFFHHQ